MIFARWSLVRYIEFTMFFFFKQKTAYEMRISDWSSDVCSSDLSSVRSRYDSETRQAEDDGWDNLEEAEPLKTVLHEDSTRHIIDWNKSPDIPFDRSINPYRGREHGCIYCFARPSNAYLGFSPGLDFETPLVLR